MKDKDKLEPPGSPSDIDVAFVLDTRLDYIQVKTYTSFRTESIQHHLTTSELNSLFSKHSDAALFRNLTTLSAQEDIRASVAELHRRRVINASIKSGERPTSPDTDPEPIKTSPDGVISLIDLLPDPKSRKLVRKMAADQFAHIHELERKGKIRAARWQLAATWGLVIWYGILYSISTVARAVRGKIAG